MGSFIMTQDNEIWVSKYLSKFEIINNKNEKIIPLKHAQIIENNSYPNLLKQVIQTKNPNLKITSQLIFVSNRSTLIKLAIQNQSNEADLDLALRWVGNSFSNKITFEKHPKGVLIDFEKNNNIEWISVDTPQGFNLEDNNYEIQIKN